MNIPVIPRPKINKKNSLPQTAACYKLLPLKIPVPFGKSQKITPLINLGIFFAVYRTFNNKAWQLLINP
jgi:hypothetical protein